MKYKTDIEILEKSKEAIGKSFGEIDKNNRISNSGNKGKLGQIIEESLYEYDINSNAHADFETAGVELKVTPYKVNKNGSHSAKERLVANVINYMDEYTKSFEESSFWNKNRKLMLFFYLHDFDSLMKDFIITETMIFEFPEEDLQIIKNDYEIIIDKIKKGLAHEISESDTQYLAACTKGSTAETSYREQPFSDIPAKQRAFSLKQSYMSTIIRDYVFGHKTNEKIIKDYNNLNSTLLDYIKSTISPFFGMTRHQLITEFEIKIKNGTIPKNINDLIMRKIFGVSKSVNSSDEFAKANIKIKTIRIQSNGTIVESMSFPAFKFTEIVKEDFYDSFTYLDFSESTFAFVIFKENTNSDYILSDVKFWTVPQEVIDHELKSIYEVTADKIRTGQITKLDMGGNIKFNLPNTSFNGIFHVRPHGRDSRDTYPLPVPDQLTGKTSYTKQSFWFNNSYIKKILSQL